MTFSPSRQIGTPCAPCTDARTPGVPRSSRQPPPHQRPLPPNTPWTRARTGHARAGRNCPRATPCGLNRRALVGGTCAAALMHSALLERRAPTAAAPGFWTKPTMLCKRRAGERVEFGLSAEAFRSGGVSSKQTHGQTQEGKEMLTNQRGGGTPRYHGMRASGEPGGERRQPGRRDAPSARRRWPAAEPSGPAFASRQIPRPLARQQITAPKAAGPAAGRSQGRWPGSRSAPRPLARQQITAHTLIIIRDSATNSSAHGRARCQNSMLNGRRRARDQPPPLPPLACPRPRLTRVRFPQLSFVYAYTRCCCCTAASLQA